MARAIRRRATYQDACDERIIATAATRETAILFYSSRDLKFQLCRRPIHFHRLVTSVLKTTCVVIIYSHSCEYEYVRSAYARVQSRTHFRPRLRCADRSRDSTSHQLTFVPEEVNHTGNYLPIAFSRGGGGGGGDFATLS